MDGEERVRRLTDGGPDVEQGGGHLFSRGQALAICTDTLAKQSHEPYAGSFVLLEPGADRPEAYAVACGPGCC